MIHSTGHIDIYIYTSLHEKVYKTYMYKQAFLIIRKAYLKNIKYITILRFSFATLVSILFKRHKKITTPETDCIKLLFLLHILFYKKKYV